MQICNFVCIQPAFADTTNLRIFTCLGASFLEMLIKHLMVLLLVERKTKHVVVEELELGLQLLKDR